MSLTATKTLSAPVQIELKVPAPAAPAAPAAPPAAGHNGMTVGRTGMTT